MVFNIDSGFYKLDDLFEHMVGWSDICYSACLYPYTHIPLVESFKWGDCDCGQDSSL